ncbi:hypothetical protein BAY61_00800 [Prauserella marina]|uniref:Uncharacterized protein n=1 Tax=Prauserella marina TaxID=530584 RepID=A0A222VIV6_9PSEU|nr:hypothetical protein [Prauserella marina]ASR33762.1 hypothetical protein BAY61_00800 [Prauserella marina]PWV82336.1 hypothetical protein DES30_102576 [Prauserella marina]SDC66711.1 hypothetical protein SAMN05421630_103112 [Prauserella marina]
MENADSARKSTRHKTPWHLWAAGIAMLALYLAGARDYLSLLEPNVDYIHSQGWGDDAIAYFTDYPLVIKIIWTINVVAGLIAPVLLFFRSRLAVAVALTAISAQVVLMLITFAFLDRWAALGAFTNLWDVGIALLTLAFWWYCRTMLKRSVLT